MLEKTLTLKGKAEWARVFPNNKHSGYENKYLDVGGVYSIVLVMPKGEWSKLKEAGTMRKLKADRMENGEFVVELERPANRYVTFKGQKYRVKADSGPPVVLDADGNKWPEGVLIGNGSEVELTVRLSTFKGKGGDTVTRTTLDAVKVLELVEYEGGEFNAEDFELVEDEDVEEEVPF